MVCACVGMCVHYLTKQISLCVSSVEIYLFVFIFPLRRSRLGESEPRSADLYRVLRDPSAPGHSPVPCALAGPGRLACGAEHGDDGYR